MPSLHLFNVREDFQGAEPVDVLQVQMPNAAAFRVAFGPAARDRGVLLYSATTGAYQMVKVASGCCEVVGQGSIERGWTSFMAFTSEQDAPCILMYNCSSGAYKFARVDGNRGIFYFTELSKGTWGPGWSAFINYYPRKGRCCYMAYNQETGRTAFCLLTPNGDGEETLHKETRERGHTSFMIYRMSARYHFMSYNVHTGDVHFCELLEGGCREVKRCKHGPGWRSFMCFRESSYLAYSPGKAAICTITHSGASGETTHFRCPFGTEWSHFVSPNWSESSTFAVLEPSSRASPAPPQAPSRAQHRKPLVVGISGPSRAGKGTLVNKLLQKVLGHRYTEDAVGAVLYAKAGRCTISSISQDSFFDTKAIYGKLQGNWEEPEAVNHAAVLQVMQQEVQRTDVQCVIFEGYQAFYDEQLVALLDVAFWLDISKQEAKRRRMATKPVPKDYFEHKLWPAHERYGGLVWSRPSCRKIQRINGEQLDQDVADQAWATLSQRLTLQ